MIDTIILTHVRRTIQRAPKMPTSTWTIVQQIECGRTHMTIPVTPARVCDRFVNGDDVVCVHDRFLGRWEVTAEFSLDRRPLSARTRKQIIDFVRFNVSVARQQA